MASSSQRQKQIDKKHVTDDKKHDTDDIKHDTNDKKKRNKKKDFNNLNSYIHKLVKQQNPEVNITMDSIRFLNDLSQCMSEAITGNINTLIKHSGTRTINSNTVISASKLFLGVRSDLTKHAEMEAAKSVVLYVDSIQK